MRPFGRNVRVRRWIAGLLLAAYGSAGVLGYGLHAVWDCDHHCHEHTHADGVAHSHHHHQGHGCQHHHDHGPAMAVADCDESAAQIGPFADCPICRFLVQAQSPLVIELSLTCTGPARIHYTIHDASYVAPLLGAHPGRGPPSV